MNKQTGVGLIEILIAVLVLSIGFLGMAALQAKALANNNSAMARTQAVIAAYSILDAMRADRTNVLTGAYNTTVTVGSCPTGTGSLAATQLSSWCTGNTNSNPPDGLAALGPNTTGKVECDGTGYCEITITFDDSRGSGGQQSQKIEIRSKV